ncbi:ATP-binding protein [Lusitaniella coriacea]|uniref:ATP-binding protein n=1 Tax=Lusitaniella coriacea TaxID=1983105 RepID=UPI003CEF32AA
MELFKTLFAADRYIPHGHCYLWQTPLVGLHVVSDILIAISYFSIPTMLLYFVYKRRDFPFFNVFILFGAFIILCGLGHILEVLTLWYPAYWLSGIEQAATALISCYTAWELSTLLPQFLSLKTPEQLEAVNQQLQQEIIERHHAEQTLKNIIKGTASVTGKAFFPALVQHLAQALNVRYAFVSALNDSQSQQLRTLAFWSSDRAIENIQYEIAGSPCEQVIQKGQLQYYPDKLQQSFPEDTALQDMGMECYLGVPLLDGQNQVLGVLCVSHDRALKDAENAKATISVFAARAAAELQRQTAESALREAYSELELRVDEATRGLRQRTTELVKVNTSLEIEIQERKRAEEEAAAASRAKSEFLANMSHELRTPLNAILGFTQVMNRDSSLSEEHLQNLKIINRAGEHLLGLIDEILEMSKIEAGRIMLSESHFDFFALLDDLEAMLQIKTESKNLILLFDRAPEVPQYITTDESRLRQVLLNLLSNAIKFTKEGGVTLRVGIRNPDAADPSTVLLAFEVEDTGAGIASNEIEELFQVFAQTEVGRQSRQGTGLGLAISQKFVQLMGGQITVKSQLDKGSIFAFNIQVRLADATKITRIRPQAKVIGLAPNQPKYRLLAVDDRFESRLLLVKLLVSLGFEVREAENGEEAVEIWSSWQPHLIWMDMRMPVMNGYEATRKIRATEEGEETTKIVALTASVFEEQRSAILSAGCDDFMRKPFREPELLAKISEHLGIQYLYEKKTDCKDGFAANSFGIAPETSGKTPIEQVKAGLPKLNPAYLDNFYNAAAQGSDRELFELIQQISPEHPTLAAALKNLADNFQFETIMELSEATRLTV